MSVIGDNIAALCELRGLTDQQVGDAIGVNRETVGRWRRGVIRGIRSSNVERLRAAFDLSVDDLRSDTRGLAAQLALLEHPESGPGNSVPLYSTVQVTDQMADWVAGQVAERVAERAGQPDERDDGRVLEPVDGAGEEPEKTPSGTRRADNKRALGLIETPSKVIRKHPGCFAFAMDDPSMDMVLPLGYHVIVDPRQEPHDNSIVVACRRDSKPTVRRLHVDGDRPVLSTESHDANEKDFVLDLGAYCIIGTVIWCQSPGEL